MPSIRLTTLFLAFLAGAAIFHVVRVNQTIGRDIGDSPMVSRVLEDDRSPRSTPESHDLTLAVFSDYQCPACRRAAPALEAAADEDGHVRIIYKEWPIFGPRSERAAALALAAHRERRYFAVQRALLRSPSLSEAGYRRAVESAGGSWTNLQGTLATHRKEITADLHRNAVEALALGLRGTPSYLVGPFLIEGGLSKAEFHRVFAQARAAQSERGL